MTSSILFDPRLISIDGLRYKWIDDQMIFDDGNDDTEASQDAQINARKAPDGGLVWDEGSLRHPQPDSDHIWQTVWTVTTEAEFEDRPLFLMINSGSSVLAGAWLETCRKFIDTLPTRLPLIFEFLTKTLASDSDRSLRFLLEDMKLQLPPGLWATLFPRQHEPIAIGAADLANALRITGVNFMTPDVPSGFTDRSPDIVTVDLRFLCPAAEAPDLLEEDGYLKFGPWVDIAGQVVAVQVRLGGGVAGFTIDG
jgi:hypothetical protein